MKGRFFDPFPLFHGPKRRQICLLFLWPVLFSGFVPFHTSSQCNAIKKDLLYGFPDLCQLLRDGPPVGTAIFSLMDFQHDGNAVAAAFPGEHGIGDKAPGIGIIHGCRKPRGPEAALHNMHKLRRREMCILTDAKVRNGLSAPEKPGRDYDDSSFIFMLEEPTKKQSHRSDRIAPYVSYRSSFGTLSFLAGCRAVNELVSHALFIGTIQFSRIFFQKPAGILYHQLSLTSTATGLPETAFGKQLIPEREGLILSLLENYLHASA